jgi:Uma2 family endonuclease
MADPDLRRMTVEEFLAWKGERDTHYQLREGTPVAMAPPAQAHGILAGNFVAAAAAALVKRPPCKVQIQAGLLSPTNARNFHEADLVVTCSAAEVGRQFTPEPLVIVEVLSPSTVDDDRRIKLPDYRLIASVQEIVLIDSRFFYCEIHRRNGDNRWLTDLLREPQSIMRLESIGLEATLATLYDRVPLEID